MLSSVASHRRFLHQIPELDDQLSQTLALVTGVLRGHRCTYFSPIQGSVCAWFDYGAPETVAFRADMDALPVQEATGVPYASRHPGQMHACGHDGHTAMALSLAQWLSEQPEKLPRNVLIIFQPSEETTGGANRICRAGVLEEYRVSRIFGLHIWPNLPEGQICSRPGAMMARSNEITVWVKGKSVHLSRAEEGSDALYAGVEFLRRSYDMADQVPPPCVLRFGKMSSGTARNIISGEAELSGSLRTYSPETFDACVSGMNRIARDLAIETGCRIGIHLSDGYPAVWNHEDLFAAVQAELGADAVQPLEKPVLAAEDFSFYQQSVPGVFFFLGAGKTAELHSPEFNFDDELILPQGVEFLKRLARLP